MSARTTAHATWRRALLTLTATSTVLAAITLPATAASAHDGGNAGVGDRAITLDGSRAFPESVAADGHYVYATSIGDGTVYRGHPGAKKLEPFLPGGQDGRTQATGVKTTGDRLLVAGAFTGRFFVYTDAGKLVSAYRVPDTGEQTLLNDAAVAANGDVYITDSFRAVVYRIPAAQVHAPATGARRTLQVAYHLPDYVAGQSNGNGIVASPDGTSLIIGYWYSGALYRLTLATGEIRRIDAPALPSADGITRLGNTLYVARSVNNEVTVLRLSGDETRATAVSERTYPGADTTTGVAVSRGRLLVTNSQMDTYLYGDPLTSPVFTLESLPLR
ncbi:SMP-30/gluconolactonase/LRE family protein [Streptomyces violaceusniger]|uniref:Superoxide dismutase n=1 Tax=Streptomyces violaceusniger (strain Tu 4113) TaxID=653045 RepID=G2NVJ5_STRV4|nr:superoxide dismutase [Streptomyces violaceusniger]AEM85879.1 superoxide dismutase [Streptomyces violaceusniger Tu 4113]